MTTDNRRVRLSLAFVASMLGVAALSIGLAPASSVGADIIIDPSLPTDPTTVPTVPPTDPPTTATTAPPTTTTSAAPTTTTTRPPVITTRPTSTTTRATTTTSGTTTRDGNRTTTATASGTSTTGGHITTAAKRRALAASTRKRAITLQGPSNLTGLAAAGGPVPADVLPRTGTRQDSRRQVPLDAPSLDARSTRSSGDTSPMTAIAVLAAFGGVVLAGFGWRAVARSSRRDRSAAPLFVGRDAHETELRTALIALVAHGPTDVSGSDCRALQLLVKVAALEGMEIRDPEGFVPRASERLVEAFGFEPDRKRLPLHWKVAVGPRSVTIPEGAQFLLQETGSDGAGRRLAFTPGTPIDLWDGDCL